MNLSTDEITSRTARGIKWNILEQAGVYGITLCGTIILSRLLLPEEYGLFGMLTIFANLATLIVGMGLGYSIIQNRELTRLDFSSIFWLNVCLGTVVAIIFFFAAPLLATFYHQPQLVVVTQYFSLVFIIQGAGSVPQGILIKAVNFRHFAFSQVTAALTSYAVAVIMALNGYGVWSLMGQVITFNTFSVLLNFYFSKWKPELHFSINAIKKVKRFSVNLLANHLIDFSATNLDSVLIGKYFGKRDLGFLGRATALSMLPVTSFGFVINRTFFPLFTSLQAEKEILQHRFLQAGKALMLVITPVLLLIGILSSDVVFLLFGSQWMPIAPVVSIFIIYASVNCFNLFHDSFLVSQGRTDILLRINIFEKVVLVICIVATLPFGLTGIAWAKASVTAVMFFPRIFALSNLIGMSPWKWFTDKTGIFIALLILVVVAFLAKVFLTEIFFLCRLLLVCAISVGAYYLALILTRERALQDVQNNIINQVKSILFKKFR